MTFESFLTNGSCVQVTAHAIVVWTAHLTLVTLDLGLCTVWPALHMVGSAEPVLGEQVAK